MSKKKPQQKAAAPEPTVFARVAPPKTPFDLIQDRVVAAVHEMNDALKAAHECADMRVFLATVGNGDQKPLLFAPLIYKLNYCEMAFSVKIADEPKMAWQHVKDPAFKDAAGQGMSALYKAAQK